MEQFYSTNRLQQYYSRKYQALFSVCSLNRGKNPLYMTENSIVIQL